ncbi:MAG: hypothetical protein C0469_18030 [Cyanobacteria bacterium DS2.3.42]|nr:hypothetical protein [Cyanobacteria bacterium DS2.3.42]
MEFTGFPRHQLRAMGRSKGRYSSRPLQSNTVSTPHSVVRTSPQKPLGTGHAGERVRLAEAPECTSPRALLDYLSQAANDLGREVIEPEVLPSFAKNTMPSVIVPPQRQRTVADEWSPNVSAQPLTQAPNQNRNFGLAESALQGLADLLTLEAGSIRDGRDSRQRTESRHDNDSSESSEIKSQACVAEFVQCARPPVDLVPAPQSSYEMLNSWLNTGRSACATADDDDDMLAFSLDEIETVSLYAEETPSAVSAAEEEALRLLDNMSSSVKNAESTEQLLSTQSQPDTHLRPALSRSHTEATPTLQMLAAGRRMESLENGAQIIKDSLGRVIEVRSPLGPVLRTRYDEQGHLRFFVRTDKEGNIQSYGESDKQGVVVHDPEGRVRAAGESMAIDRVGRLSIVRKDGQFWSIDLARGLHVERRQMVDEDGQWTAITAVFAYDGFRMVTRFQTMDAREFDEEEGCYLPTSGSICKEEIRLYGRDGSCVQFDSEDAIEELRPSRVWPPGSRAVDKKYRNRWQAGTAWQAVREYLELLKSGSG